jgi:toxin ParE1/3/4
MTNICRFTIPASRDLENILDYLAAQGGINRAEIFLKKINQKFKTLASFPNMGKSRDELLPKLRSFPMENYLIFYRPIEEGIEVLRVVSGYQNLTKLFEE